MVTTTRVDGMMMDGTMMTMIGGEEDGMKERMNLFVFNGDFDVGRRDDRGGGEEEDRLLGEVLVETTTTRKEDNEPTTTTTRRS